MAKPSVPHLASRTLPLLDIIFLLLALFLLLPHGAFPQKNSSLPPLQPLRQSGQQILVYEDVPLEIYVSSDNTLSLRWKVGPLHWKKKSFSAKAVRNLTWQNLKGQLLKSYDEALQYTQRLRKSWRDSNKAKQKRPPTVVVVVYIHPHAKVFWPLKVQRLFRQKECTLVQRLWRKS